MIDETRRESPDSDPSSTAGDDTSPAVRRGEQAPQGPARRGGSPAAPDVERAVESAPETR